MLSRSSEQRGVHARRASQSQLFEETRHAEEDRAVPASARGVSKRCADVAFPDTRFSNDDDVVLGLDPLAS